jgi:hypothetical protein
MMAGEERGEKRSAGWMCEAARDEAASSIGLKVDGMPVDEAKMDDMGVIAGDMRGVKRS